MTGRQLAGVWAAAFALVLTIVIALLPLDENDHAHPHQAIRKVLEATPAWDTIVIGSSLTRAAFPPVTGPASLPDRTAVRISRSSLKQNELLLIAEYALAAGADEIFIEAERLARTTSVEPGAIRTWIGGLAFSPFWAALFLGLGAGAILQVIGGLAQPGRRNLKGILKGESHGTWKIDGESRYLDGKIPPRGLEFESTYFVKPTPLRNLGRWDAFLKDAKERGTSVNLLVYPRSQAASDFLADADEDAVRQAIILFAERHGLALFYPAVAWPNEFFADRGHVNQLGRDRYLRELAAWLEAQA